MADQDIQPISGGVFSGLMLRARWLVAGSALGFVGPQATGMGQSGRGPAEEIGQAVDRVARSGAASLGLGGKVDDGQAAADQVDGRLASDKSLDASKIEVRKGTGGAVELHGVVASQQAKERAVSVAGNTRGVSEVVDSLAVTPGKRILASPVDPEATDPGLSPAPKSRSSRAVQASHSAPPTRKAVQ